MDSAPPTREKRLDSKPKLRARTKHILGRARLGSANQNSIALRATGRKAVLPISSWTGGIHRVTGTDSILYRADAGLRDHAQSETREHPSSASSNRTAPPFGTIALAQLSPSCRQRRRRTLQVNRVIPARSWPAPKTPSVPGLIQPGIERFQRGIVARCTPHTEGIPRGAAL